MSNHDYIYWLKKGDDSFHHGNLAELAREKDGGKVE